MLWCVSLSARGSRGEVAMAKRACIATGFGVPMVKSLPIVPVSLRKGSVRAAGAFGRQIVPPSATVQSHNAGYAMLPGDRRGAVGG